MECKEAIAIGGMRGAIAIGGMRGAIAIGGVRGGDRYLVDERGDRGW